MPNHLPTLVRKELLAHLRTMRLVVALIFTVVLCLLTTLMGSLDYSRNVSEYERLLKEDRIRLNSVETIERAEPNTFLPPQPVQILCRGIVQAAGQSFNVEVGEYVIGARSLGRSSADDMLFTLSQVDFVGVVSLVLSFLAIVLGFDAICGEREQGTLRLLLSHSVPRAQIVLAKLIGGFLSVCTPLALAYALSLLVLQFNPDVEFSGDDWLRLFMLFVLTCLFLFEVYALAVLVSAYTRRAAASLIICLFGWLVLGAGFSSSLPAVARYTLDWPPWMDYVEQRNQEWSHWGSQLHEWEEQNPRPPDAAFAGLERDGVLRYAHPSAYEWLDARAEFEFNKTLERADRVHRHRTQNQMPLADQQFAVDEWSILSPVTGYRVLAKWIARSTLDDAFQVAYHGVRYRDTFIDYLRGRFASQGWRRWYTDDPPDTPPMIEDPASVTPDMLREGSDFMRQRMAWAEARWQHDQDDPRRKLDWSDLPTWGPDWRRDTGQTLGKMMPGLLVMILTIGLSVLLTLRRFSRYTLS